MITTKTCSTCEHFPNDHHCVGCLWDEAKRENTRWELKKNPIVIERAVLDKVRAEIMAIGNWSTKSELPNGYLIEVLEIIDKYKAESEG